MNATLVASYESLRNAATWRLLGLLFERPRPGWCEEMEAVAREIEDPEFDRLVARTRDATEGAYLAILGPGGQVSPREVAYCPREDPGALMAKLNVFYDAFSYRPRVEDPADHIAVETGFVGYLLLKEIYAWSSGNSEAEATAREARGKFLEAHLGSFAEQLARRLEGVSGSYLREAAKILTRKIPTA